MKARINAMLIFPEDPDLRQLSGKRVPLTLTTEHKLSRNGVPVVVDGDGELVTVESFRRLRVKLGAWIETDNAASLCEALGTPEGEVGIIPMKEHGLSSGPVTL